MLGNRDIVSMSLQWRERVMEREREREGCQETFVHCNEREREREMCKEREMCGKIVHSNNRERERERERERDARKLVHCTRECH